MIMKNLFLTFIAIMAIAINASAKSWEPVITNVSSSSVVYQNGYTRSNGTYVQGHYKTRSNNTNLDNFSTIGNYNPFTGSIGSIAKDYSAGAYNYGAGKTIHVGSRGGQYYINSNGNKTYVPKRSINSFLW